MADNQSCWVWIGHDWDDDRESQPVNRLLQNEGTGGDTVEDDDFLDECIEMVWAVIAFVDTFLFIFIAVLLISFWRRMDMLVEVKRDSPPELEDSVILPAAPAAPTLVEVDEMAPVHVYSYPEPTSHKVIYRGL